jgi:hypothetical protein
MLNFQRLLNVIPILVSALTTPGVPVGPAQAPDSPPLAKTIQSAQTKGDPIVGDPSVDEQIRFIVTTTHPDFLPIGPLPQSTQRAIQRQVDDAILAVNLTATQLKVPPLAVAQTIAIETGNQFSPATHNGEPGKPQTATAFGLIQMTTPGLTPLKKAGVVPQTMTLNDIMGMTVPEQVTRVVVPYFKFNADKTPITAHNLYPLVAAGNRATQVTSNTVIYPAGTPEADDNPAWQEPNGNVTLQSINKSKTQHWRDSLDQAQRRLGPVNRLIRFSN